ncbi:MAG TPA: hypothetical protein VNN80_20010 [Polyangiaceae bacterium]|nr:hypothetical protein [Polyangiaceae bacterium]
MHRSLNTLGLRAVLCLGCAAASTPEVKAPPAPASAVPAPEPALPKAASLSWPARARSLLARAEDRLVLRAFGPSGLEPFEHVIARDVLEQLYDAELELLWFSDMGGRLWVGDLRALGAAAPPNVLIASDLPEHEKLSVWVGDRYVQGFGQLGEGSVELSLRWQESPWFETDAGERLGRINGGAWLERERQRPARALAAWQQPDEQGPHVVLPAGVAQCDNPELCGAARAFGASRWQLVITKTDETHGDFAHYGCLLHDPARPELTRPQDARRWAPARDAELDTCGPYQFNAAGDAFLVDEQVCRTGGECAALEGRAVGWLEPGVTVGRE